MDDREAPPRLQNGAHGDGAPDGPEAAPNALWFALGVLYRSWRRVALITAVVAAAAVAIALLLPREYAAEARVLNVQGGGPGSLFGMMDRATGGLGRLLTGSSGGDYTRSLAILHSRALRERVVNEFDLAQVYGVADRPHPMEAALARLDKNLAFDVSLAFDYLGVVAFDRDPARAAAMANFVVAELNRFNAELTSDNARQSRVFVEQRLREAEAELDSARAGMQRFQERHGLVEMESQAQAFMGGVAALRGRAAEAEVRYQTLLQQYGPDNPQVLAARDALAASRRQVAGALGGRDATLPVSLRALPALTREYAEMMQAQLIQAQIIETLYPVYEQARFQERNDAETLQVLDAAVVPIHAARPSRRTIVLVATLSGLLAACLFVLGQAWLREHHHTWAARLRASTPPRLA